MNLRRLSIAVLFISLIVASGSVFLPSQARAQGIGASIVMDPWDIAQNTISALTNAKVITNPLFWSISQALINSIVKSTVNWINSGFHGSPAFVTNLNTTLLQAGDTQAQLFINQFLASGSVKSPFSDQVGQAALNNYLQSSGGNSFFNQNSYTLNQTSQNPSAFLGGNFSQGGLPAWLSTSLGTLNNPILAQNATQLALGQVVGSAQSNLLTQLGWGSGFKSFQGNCGSGLSSPTPVTANAPVTGGPSISPTTQLTQVTSPTVTTPTAGGSSGLTSPTPVTANAPVTGGPSISPTTQLTQVTSPAVSLTNFDNCVGQPIQTPGTIIMASLNKSLGTGIDSLLNAKEFDELVSALLGQLLNQVLGPGGLSGVSQPSATGQSFLSGAATTTNVSAGLAVAASMYQIVNTQIAGLQQFVTNWQAILNAATAAKTALSASTCTPNAAAIITSTVQPVIDQATLEISRGTTAINSLQTISAEIPSAASTGDTTLQSSKASTDYNNFLASPSTPSAADISYAQTQSQNTGTTTPASLLTQMNQLTTQAQQCGP